MFRWVAVLIASTVTMVAAHGQSSSQGRLAPTMIVGSKSGFDESWLKKTMAQAER